jgi:hypothetical protein
MQWTIEYPASAGVGTLPEVTCRLSIRLCRHRWGMQETAIADT